MRPREQRRGFALLAVLWVLVALATLALSVSLVARDAIAAARNRTDLTRASWLASGCMEQARAEIGGALLAPPIGDSRGLSGWAALDASVLCATSLIGSGCRLTFVPAGSRIDVNHADAEMLGSALRTLGVTEPARDSALDAILDWRDADDVPRPLGAERQWYAEHHRFGPRNGPIADVRELARIRGLESVPGLESVFGVEPGRIALAHASMGVISALPGIDEEALSRIGERRASGAPVGDVTELASQLAPASRERLVARFSDLTRASTVDPDAWIVQSRATVGTPDVTVVVELRLTRAGARAAVVRRRSWIL
jgi:general secretion pathway protein K